MAVRFDDNLKNQIRQATDIVELISEYMSLNRKGKEWVGVCPFHQDHRPSMYVSPAKQIFKCFACGAAGDSFKFVQMRENISFPEAVERLAGRVGIQLEHVSRPQPAEGGSSGIDGKGLAKVNQWALNLWKQNFSDEQKGQSARNYLAERQISDESIEQWGLGFAVDRWDDLVGLAKSTGLGERWLLGGGLAVARDNGGLYDKFRNRLMFPILDVTGRVIAFGGRTLGDDPAKYMNSPATVLFDKSNSLYGLDKARHEMSSSGTAIIVEGYTDVIMCHQFGVTNVVATLGTSLTSGHVRILRRYAKRVVLVFDSDVAGMAAANRALDVCLAEGVDISLAFVGEGKDPCDFLLASGKEAFDKVVAEATDVMEFKWNRLVDSLEENSTMVDKRGAVEEYLRSVAAGMQGQRASNLVDDGLRLSRLAEMLSMDKNEVNKQIKRFMRSPGSGNSGYSVANSKVVSLDLGSGYLAEAQREILEALLAEPALFQKVRGVVKSQDFDVEVLSEVAEALFGALEEDEKSEIGDVLVRIESVEGGQAAVLLAQRGEKKGNCEQMLQGALNAFDRHRYERKITEVKASLRDDETESLRRLTESLRISKS